MITLTDQFIFLPPINRNETIRVDYRYSGKNESARTVGGPGAIPLSFANNKAQVKLGFGYKASNATANGNTVDILTYGINANTSLGNLGSLTSLMYTASPESSNRLSISDKSKNKGLNKDNYKRDDLMVQNAILGTGALKVNLGMQDVGENFAGFASMRENQAAASDVLNQLEKEKGLKRQNIGISLAMSGGALLSLSQDSIKDKLGSIASQSFGYTGSAFKFNMSSREVDKKFSRFKDIKEEDRNQIAAEAGLKRTNYALGFKTGINADKSVTWSNFASTMLEDGENSLTKQSIDLTLGKMQFTANTQSMDKGFKKMTALNAGEKTGMGLAVKRQFNMNAKESDVNDNDRNQFNNEAGINRSLYSFKFNSGKTNFYASMADLDNGKDNLERRAFTLTNDQYSLFYKNHTIGNNFDRIGSLQQIEKSEYGNEYGMNRTSMGGSIKMALGNFSYMQSGVADKKTSGVARQSFSFNNAMIKFKANIVDIDKAFNRINDLADNDKDFLKDLRGFNYSDYSINYQATKQISIDSFLMDAANSSKNIERSRRKNLITYNGANGFKITHFMDDSITTDKNKIAENYNQRKTILTNTFNLFGGLAFNATQEAIESIDTKNTAESIVTQTHAEASPSKLLSFSRDTFTADWGDGKFEDTQKINAKIKVNSTLSMVTGYATTERWDSKDEKNYLLGADWNLRKDLKLNLSIANRLDGKQGTQKTRTMSLSGTLIKKLWVLNDVVLNSTLDTNVLKGKQNKCDNSFKLTSGILGGSLTIENGDKLNQQNHLYYASRLLNFVSDKSPEKWYHFSYSKNYFREQKGNNVKISDYMLDMKISKNMSFNYHQFFGKKNSNGLVMPVGTSSMKLINQLKNGNAVTIDYQVDVDNIINKSVNVLWLGIGGKMDTKTTWEAFYGFARKQEGAFEEKENLYRAKFDRQLNDNQFLTFSAEKRSLASGFVNPDEGEKVFRVDYRSLLN